MKKTWSYQCGLISMHTLTGIQLLQKTQFCKTTGSGQDTTSCGGAAGNFWLSSVYTVKSLQFDWLKISWFSEKNLLHTPEFVLVLAHLSTLSKSSRDSGEWYRSWQPSCLFCFCIYYFHKFYLQYIFVVQLRWFFFLRKNEPFCRRLFNSVSQETQSLTCIGMQFPAWVWT